MSVRPLPRPESEPEPEPAQLAAADAEGWALLESLRRRIDDQTSQGRKTQQQVTQLAESIAALVSEQRSRSKLLNLNSFVAYLIFTLLVGAGFFLLYRSRATELVEARDLAKRERDQAVKRADETTTRLAQRDKADALAWEVYELLEAGKRSEAAGKLDALREQPLSRTERAVLAARAHETHVVQVDAALKSAAASFKAGRHADVLAPLEAALVSEPAGARAAVMRYYLGVAYAKTNQLDKAIAHLTAAIAADVDQDDVRFQLASALDRAGQYAKARAEYDRFATAKPQSSFAAFAMRRSATLARMPAVAPPPAQPGVPTPPPGAGAQPGAFGAPGAAQPGHPGAVAPGAKPVQPGAVAPGAQPGAAKPIGSGAIGAPGAAKPGGPATTTPAAKQPVGAPRPAAPAAPKPIAPKPAAPTEPPAEPAAPSE